MISVAQRLFVDINVTQTKIVNMFGGCLCVVSIIVSCLTAIISAVEYFSGYEDVINQLSHHQYSFVIILLLYYKYYITIDYTE